MTGAELSQVITSLATLIASVGAVAVGLRNGRRGEERSRVTNDKVDQVHQTTNGLSERNEAIARKLGVAEGKQAERENPT